MKEIKLPVMQCDKGCGDCCGPVFCTPDEFNAAKRYALANEIEPKRQGLTCPFYQDGGCKVYKARPLICRMFGHSPRLVCSKGYNRNISPALEERLMDGYRPTRMLHELCYSSREIRELHQFEIRLSR